MLLRNALSRDVVTLVGAVRCETGADLIREPLTICSCGTRGSKDRSADEQKKSNEKLKRFSKGYDEKSETTC